MTSIPLKWGHPLLDPEGKEIRVPDSVFEPLKKMKLLERCRKTGVLKLKPIIYSLIGSNDSSSIVLGDIARVLGKDLSGPEWVQCRCNVCTSKERNKSRINRLYVRTRDAKMGG